MKPLKTIQKHDINENLDFFVFWPHPSPIGSEACQCDPWHPSGDPCWQLCAALESPLVVAVMLESGKTKNPSGWSPAKKNNPSGGQRAGNWPSPALQQHHSGTGRKDTQDINVVGTNINLKSFFMGFLFFNHFLSFVCFQSILTGFLIVFNGF